MNDSCADRSASDRQSTWSAKRSRNGSSYSLVYVELSEYLCRIKEMLILKDPEDFVSLLVWTIDAQDRTSFHYR